MMRGRTPECDEAEDFVAWLGESPPKGALRL